jgi:polygalacturonase
MVTGVMTCEKQAGIEDGGEAGMMTSNRMLASVAAMALAIGLPVMGQAQDRRQVSEPGLPARACARLTAGGGNDWRALQDAIDACPSGQAVHLVSGAFVSGPLVMKSGVSLWLDKGWCWPPRPIRRPMT